MTRRVSLEPEKSLGKVRNRVPAAARDDSEERNRLYCKVYDCIVRLCFVRFTAWLYCKSVNGTSSWPELERLFLG